ncbi:MAG: helix-turn-helix transcriptional regulator [Rhodospirillales bacterium]|nr:helix-turn-helix transcriptional regulator [Rhodospirillales bacterium]
MELTVFDAFGMSCGMISAAQCRAARGLLKWNQEDLAKAAEVGIVSIRQFEGERTAPHRATLAAIQRAFEAAGIVFIPANGGGAGIRLNTA